MTKQERLNLATYMKCAIWMMAFPHKTKEYNRRYYLRRRTIIIARTKAYHRKHSSAFMLYRLFYRLMFPDLCRKQAHAAYLDLKGNPHRRRAYAATDRRNHPERSPKNNTIRRLRKLCGAYVCYDQEAVDKIYQRAAVLKRWFNVVVDHVVPLSRGGQHCGDNLQIIYRSENAQKGTSLTYTPRVIFR